jgi:uncharacterized membrane protein
MLNTIQKNKIKNNLSWRNLIFFFIWVILFSFINFYFNDLKTVGFWFLHYENFIKIPYILFWILNALLIGLSINLLIDKMKEIKSINPSAWILSMIWTFFALLTWACPGCIAGVFPVFVWMFGSNITMYNLPFHWTELQVFSFILLIVWIYFLSLDITCKINKKVKIKHKKKLISIILLAIIWTLDAAYLTYSSFLSKTQTKVFGWWWELWFACDINSTFSCSSVFNESFAWILWIPFSGIALAIYPILAIIAVLWLKWKMKNSFKILLILSILWLIFNLYIIFNEYLVGVYCLLCLLCTGIIITIWVLSYIWLKNKDNK